MKKLFSILALASMFAACQPEPIVTAFELVNAVVEVEVSAVDVQTGAETTDFEILGVAGAKVEGKKLIFDQEEDFSARKIDVSVKYNKDGKEYTTKDVQLPSVQRGGKATVYAMVVVNEPIIKVDEPAELTVNVKAYDVLTKAETDKFTIVKAEGIANTIDGKNIIIKGDKDIKATDLTITVKFTGEGAGSGKEYSQIVSIPEVLPSVKLSIDAMVNVNEPAADPEVNAVATITVKAIDVRTGELATNPVSIKADKGTVAGNVITITGTPKIEATVVKVTATYEGKDYITNVNIPELIAGISVAYDATVIVGEHKPVDPVYSFRFEKVSEDVVTEKEYLTDAVDHGTEYMGHTMWNQNNEEYSLEYTVAYKEYKGAKVTTINVIDNDFKPIIDGYAGAFNVDAETGYIGIDKTVKFTISAYCWFTIWQERNIATTSYKVYAKADENPEVEIGNFEVTSIASTVIQYLEAEAPSDAAGHGHGHYVPGHGHGSQNAGGGIAFAD